MKKVLNYLPLHFIVLLIVGILAQFYLNLWDFGFINLFVLLGSIAILVFIIPQKIIRTFLAFFLFFFMGISAVFFNNDTNYKNYYQHAIKEDTSVIFKIEKILKPSLYHDKYEAIVLQVDSSKTKGKILLNISKDSILNSLKVDELLFAKPDFRAINEPSNPHQFEYKFYLAKQGIHQQVFLEQEDFKSLGLDQFSLIGMAAKFRNQVQESLKKYNFKVDELAVINALLLGQRQDISKDLIEDYSKAGAIHILAVSGLHVGIILLILSSLLKPLERLKNGRVLKITLIVLLLWMFAFVAGLSASVVRAVAMFTFLAIGLSFKRKNVILFSLITSMFFLLLFNPMFLFDVGFQLSYLAVFGIIWIQPKLYKIYKPRFKLDDKIWQLFTVSMAAQLGVLPLSLYYFHQFPGLFLLSNLLIIPFLGAILIGGIVIIMLALVGLLPQTLASIYGFVISLMNNFVNWISKQEQFLFTDISLSFLMMLATYLVIIFGVYFLIKKSPKKLIYFLVSLLIIQSVFLFENHQKNTKNELIVFHKSRNSIMANRAGANLLVHHDLDSLAIGNTNAMVSYQVGENVKSTYSREFPNILKFKNQPILIVDSLGVYNIQNLKNPIVILRNSPKINLERLIKTLQPAQIIADGNNYKSYVNSWKETSRKQKTPFHSTEQNGAYILK
ncbi:ComEC/Rec2 family competence protein [Polaribacter sp. Hel_I_88]|uniref:ComEC/Rec2 family competence protein n=1 Tax=Polaribacter sp. Hel_I_88 TaxID=1250006 RepID=UPI00047A7E27|nr:ComEC/Rec2 family competence protein [Polaribacter sp. Hel_I_88]